MPENAATDSPAGSENATATETSQGLSVPIGEIGSILDRMGFSQDDGIPDPAAKVDESPLKEPETPVKAAEPAAKPSEKPAKPEASDGPPESLFEAKPAAPKEEVPVFEPIPKEPPPEMKSQKAIERWNKMHSQYEVAVAKAEKAQKELEAIKASPPDAGAEARIKQLEARLMEMSAGFERIDLEQHPAIQQQIIKPRQDAFKQMSELLTNVGIEPDAMEKALSYTGKKRIDALDELNEQITSPTVRTQLNDLALHVQRLDQKKDALFADIKGNRERLDLEARAEKHRTMQNQNTQLTNLAQEAFEELRDKVGFEFMREVPGNDKWNEGVKARYQASMDLLLKNTDPKQLVGAALLAPQAVVYRSAYLNTRAELQAVKKELAEIKGAAPGLSGGSRSSNGADGALSEEMDFKTLIRRVGRGE